MARGWDHRLGALGHNAALTDRLTSENLSLYDGWSLLLPCLPPCPHAGYHHGPLLLWLRVAVPPQPLLSGPPASRGFAGSPAAVAVPSWALGLLPVPSGGCGVGGAMLISHTFGPSTGDSSGVLRAQILVSEASIWTGPLSKMAPMML